MESPVHRSVSRNWLGISLAFLVGVFIGGAVVGFLLPRTPRLPRILGDDEFEAIASPFVFAQWKQGSVGDAAGILKNNVYAHLDGRPALGITFADDKRDRIESVTVHDIWGRSWISVNLDKPYVSVDLYEQDNPTWTDEPKYSMKDEGADGIPDSLGCSQIAVPDEDDRVGPMPESGFRQGGRVG